jgi:hypothetical protein
VVSVSTPGVLLTGMPSSVAAGTSMLSKPTAKFATPRRPGFTDSTSRSIRSVSSDSSTSAQAAPSSTSSRLGEASSAPGQTRTWAPPSRSCASPASRMGRVTKTFPLMDA